ncbi:alpha-1,4-glucan:maltose-1-phosphate maltosyltransferase [Faunimonas pinastri]|uniref:Alpha-1,4-glucan:maltose-1-phosphate maltosyltransferase n=1 Tax=Faunimonas pinastri TaxID=1855383 RepID=A0A1H9LVW9_9HYPH|nr:alpha-1,4-glucan--maltose-1-phosphate maltosyltransferase [Faunimonas pinastri]SER15622.1 alpha-1,4-glucan:maltose-1-phosphate maltosyltransferase [Faunimonas pinastri]
MNKVQTPQHVKEGRKDKSPEAAQVETTHDIGDFLKEIAGNRVAIENVSPEIDGGRFPARIAVGEPFQVEADVFCDGHDKIDAAFLVRRHDETEWHEHPLVFVENDRWRGSVVLGQNTRYLYTVIAWRDLFAYWRYEVTKKHGAGVPIHLELMEGRTLVERALKGERGGEKDKAALRDLLACIDATEDDGDHLSHLMAHDTAALMKRAGPRTDLSRYDNELELIVDRKAAAFSAWYEMMPRSQSGDANRHGTFDDVIKRLPYVRDLGFDVLYFPPIHPIGKKNRKGKNNSLTPSETDPGSPYAIGSEEGGHDALHPELGTFEDFARLIDAARDHGLEIAIDFAIQCSPDHPWIKQHPEWFDWRPDGSIKYAENPPKKYEDIVNVDFYREGAFPSLWYALRDVVLFWCEKGIKIFRVDNPHTKPFPFWEWMIRGVQDRYPETIFLAEAFTRPKVMARLAKVGFNQSYSYFTWRNTKAELTQYLTELTTSETRHFMRPNFFANTPDINPVFLHASGRAGFQIRLLLAATLGGNYGIYNGFEVLDAEPVPGKEEYLNSEKYEIRAWDWDRPGHIRPDIRLMNKLRRDHPALQSFTNVTFYNAWNDNILFYGKATPGRDDFLLFMVNLDPHNPQGAHFEIPLWEFGLPDEGSIEMEDLVTGERIVWHGKTQHWWLDPNQRPYAIWRLVPPGEIR